VTLLFAGPTIMAVLSSMMAAPAGN
jgi:hypothetical protein